MGLEPRAGLGAVWFPVAIAAGSRRSGRWEASKNQQKNNCSHTSEETTGERTEVFSRSALGRKSKQCAFHFRTFVAGLDRESQPRFEAECMCWDPFACGRVKRRACGRQIPPALSLPSPAAH